MLLEEDSNLMPSASVCAILKEGTKASGPELLLVKRTISSRDPWSGQMAFPGGRSRPDESLAGDCCPRSRRRNENQFEKFRTLGADGPSCSRKQEHQGLPVYRLQKRAIDSGICWNRDSRTFLDSIVLFHGCKQFFAVRIYEGWKHIQSTIVRLLGKTCRLGNDPGNYSRSYC